MQVVPQCPNISCLAVWLPIIVNAVLAGFVLWYTLETRWLRRQNQEQLEFLKRQVRQSIAPFVIPSLKNLPTMLSLMNEREGPADAKSDFEKNLRKEYGRLRYLSSVANLTDNLALNIHVYAFEHKSLIFFPSSEGRTFLSKTSDDGT